MERTDSYFPYNLYIDINTVNNGPYFLLFFYFYYSLFLSFPSFHLYLISYF